jgi:hypothetical protein
MVPTYAQKVALGKYKFSVESFLDHKGAFVRLHKGRPAGAKSVRVTKDVAVNW